MPLTSPQLRRFVQRALMEAAGAAHPDRAALAAAFTKLCEFLHQRLKAVFGATAVVALFARGLTMAAVEFPWLAAVIAPGGAGCSFENVAALQQIETETVEAGLAAVLAQDIELLTTFVGEDLILPVIQEAWGAAVIDQANLKPNDA
jgi:hypothetical protein